jgi:hypothetical protein
MLHVPTKYAARVVVELSLLGPLTDFAAFCKVPSQLIILISFTSATISAALSQRHYLHIHIRHISVNSKFLQNHDDAQIWLANHIKATKNHLQMLPNASRNGGTRCSYGLPRRR